MKSVEHKSGLQIIGHFLTNLFNTPVKTPSSEEIKRYGQGCKPRPAKVWWVSLSLYPPYEKSGTKVQDY